jgi:hypothetical protein
VQGTSGQVTIGIMAYWNDGIMVLGYWENGLFGKLLLTEDLL